jgi:lysozyme
MVEDPRTPIHDFLKPFLRDAWNSPGLLSGFESHLDDLGAAKLGPTLEQVAAPVPMLPVAKDPSDPLTPRVALEIVSHEAIVQEAYLDSVNVWTWSVGITDKSGHSVMRYKDNPQPLQKCLEVFIWLLRKNYIPAVLDAFYGRTLTEAQFAAALSFHYNTGAIGRASWVKAPSRQGMLEWRKPPEIIGRRTKEADLFFDGKWSQDGKVTVLGVNRSNHHPSWKSARRIDISADIAALLG